MTKAFFIIFTEVLVSPCLHETHSSNRQPVCAGHLPASVISQSTAQEYQSIVPEMTFRWMGHPVTTARAIAMTASVRRISNTVGDCLDKVPFHSSGIIDRCSLFLSLCMLQPAGWVPHASQTPIIDFFGVFFICSGYSCRWFLLCPKQRRQGRCQLWKERTRFLQGLC